MLSYNKFIMNTFSQTINAFPLAYVSRDIERAIGLGRDIPGLVIISNNTPFAKQLQEQAKRTQIVLIDAPKLLDTWHLLAHATTADVLTATNITRIAVFKPTKKIERICVQKGWKLLNPSAELSSRIEEKISQVEWLGTLTKYLPQHQILTCKEVAWNFEPCILQFNHAHTGNGTILIESKEQLEVLKQKFPDRPVRISAFISGPMVTTNTVVTKTDVLIGNISYQITGMAPFTSNPFATVGNDWGVIPTVLPYPAQSQLKEIAHAVGKKLQADGWKGAFGIDAIYEEKTHTVYLIEINARQPASVSFESILQTDARTKRQENLFTTAEAHMAALLGADMTGAKLIPITDGAQVILRNGSYNTPPITRIMQSLQKKGYSCIPYTNRHTGSDLLRIQSTTHLMAEHNTWNSRGKQLATLIHEFNHAT